MTTSHGAPASHISLIAPTAPNSPRNVALLLADSELVRLRGRVPLERPAPTHRGDGRTFAAYASSNPDGNDGGPLTDYDVIGSATERTGVFAFGDGDPFNLLCIPPLAREHPLGPSALLVAARLCRERREVLEHPAPLLRRQLRFRVESHMRPVRPTGFVVLLAFGGRHRAGELRERPESVATAQSRERIRGGVDLARGLVFGLRRSLRGRCLIDRVPVPLGAIRVAIELDQQLARDPNLGHGGRLLEGIGGIPAGVCTPQAPDPDEQLVGPRDGRDVEAALGGDTADRHLGAPGAGLHALVPVQPEHPLGGGWDPLRPEPALERLRSQAEVLLADEPRARVPRFLWAHGSRAQILGGHSIPFALHELAINRGSDVFSA